MTSALHRYMQQPLSEAAAGVGEEEGHRAKGKEGKEGEKKRAAPGNGVPAPSRVSTSRDVLRLPRCQTCHVYAHM